MAILQILHFPDKRLRTCAEPIDTVDDTVRGIVSDMFETMYESQGIGLAATQVNIHRRIIVLDISESRDEPLCLINPEIVKREGSEKTDEGCLSVPGIFETVQRAAQIQVRALDREGRSLEFETNDLLAVCIQHEIDHLEGKLFVDYLSPLKRERIRKKLEKMRKHTM